MLPFMVVQVDYLVNNAGRSQRAVAMETTLAVDKAALELNTLGTISLTKATLPHLVKQGGGAIVVISSVAGKMGESLGDRERQLGHFIGLQSQILLSF